jgi:predicted short-subunit dehydrogenase-like oxidoreductase (DUF2520 family)
MRPETSALHPHVAVVGAGRLGTALADALRDAGLAVDGPLGRGATAAGADVALLCVPDAEIAAAAACLAPGALAGHCSGASTLAPLGAREALSLHPLMTVTPAGARFAGATAAVAGSSPLALALARSLAGALGMTAVEVADEDRAAYHAAASIASNFLVALEEAAARLAATAGVDREALVPLARAALENWAAGGPGALTGPIARGDEATVMPSAPPCTSAPPGCWRCSTRWRPSRGTSPAAGWPHEDRAHRRRAARRPRRPPPGG